MIFTSEREHNEEQQGICNFCNANPQAYVPGSFQCLLGVHVGDVKGTARRGTAESLLKHPNEKVGRRNVDYVGFLYAGIQRESFSGFVFTRQYVYIGGITPIDDTLLLDKMGKPYAVPKFTRRTGPSSARSLGLR